MRKIQSRFHKSLLLILISVLMVGCSSSLSPDNSPQSVINLSSIPAFDGKTPYVELNGNVPNFTDEEKKSVEIVEEYPELDELGRCQSVFANLHVSNMPTEDRESIGMIKPSGWVTAKYDFVDGKYLYNRCHLIGFQLAGENANDKNLITGTRYMNVEGMLPLENIVADYLRDTGNHVLYRVTPIFQGDELVARGVQMEAYSVEDNGKGIQFNVYCYNNQPGVNINYMTGESSLAEEKIEELTEEDTEVLTFIINTSSKKFHTEDCVNAGKIKEGNKLVKESTKVELMREGYEPAQCCVE